MVQKFRERSNGEGGFTLVELLVVMLILGLLAAIAIPSFFNQRDKAKDADAKAGVRTAQTAMETYATSEGGEYTGADATDLQAIESTLNDTTLTATPNAAGDGYTVEATSETGNEFSITRYGESDAPTPAEEGTTSYDCTTGGTAGCPTDGNWAE